MSLMPEIGTCLDALKGSGALFGADVTRLRRDLLACSDADQACMAAPLHRPELRDEW